MSQKEEDLDEKIARIRRQNAAIIQRQEMIKEEIQDCKKKNAIVNLKTPVSEESDDGEFGPTLYSDKLSHEKRIVKPTPDNVWGEKPAPRKNFHRGDKEEEWREERKRIDEERIRRQKANSGSWKREWDANKVPLNEEKNNWSTSRTPNNAFNRSYRNEKSENRGNYYSNESKGTFHYDTEINENESQNRWKNDRPIRRNNSERRSSDHDDRGPSRPDNWGTNILETDQFNNNPVKPSRSDNTNFNRTVPPISDTANILIEKWDLPVEQATESNKVKMNEWHPLSGNTARAADIIKPVIITDWRVLAGDNVIVAETNKPKENEWRTPLSENVRTIDGNKRRANEWRVSNDDIKFAEIYKPNANEWRTPVNDHVETIETNKPRVNEWRTPASDHVRTIQTNKPRANEWRTPASDHIRTIQSNKPRSNEWRIPATDHVRTIETKPKANEWRSSSDIVKVTETNKQKNDWRSSSGDPRPIAVRGSKWDRPSDTYKNKPTSNLDNRLNRYNKSPDTLKNTRNEALDLDESIKATIPKDLKNIIIHVKSFGTDDKREVEVLNDVKTNSNNSSPSDSEQNNREFEAYENASGYGQYDTMTFERSDLKRTTEHEHYDDLSTQTSIITQMFSNSKLNDDNFPANSDSQTGSLTQIYENSDVPFQPLNFEQPDTFVDEKQRQPKSQDLKIVRTIKKENVVLKKPEVVKCSKKPIKSPNIKNTKIEIKDSDLGGEEEWEDASGEEWEDIDEEEVV